MDPKVIVGKAEDIRAACTYAADRVVGRAFEAL
jgi:hypothetical protein